MNTIHKAACVLGIKEIIPERELPIRGFGQSGGSSNLYFFQMLSIYISQLSLTHSLRLPSECHGMAMRKNRTCLYIVLYAFSIVLVLFFL